MNDNFKVFWYILKHLLTTYTCLIVYISFNGIYNGIYNDGRKYDILSRVGITQFFRSLASHLILRMQIVSTNPVLAMKIYPELFYLMIYQLRFSSK